MSYLVIDQHARKIIISLRDERGDVLPAQQVSTKSEKVRAFLHQLTRERLLAGEMRRGVSKGGTPRLDAGAELLHRRLAGGRVGRVERFPGRTATITERTA